MRNERGSVHFTRHMGAGRERQEGDNSFLYIILLLQSHHQHRLDLPVDESSV